MSSLGTSAPADRALALVAAAGELVGAAWSEVGGPEALDVAATIATARGLLDAVLLHCAERVEATHAAEAAGWAGTKEFLTHVTGGTRGEGGGLIRALAQLDEVPTVRVALDAGAITLPQARAIAAEAAGVPRHSGLRTAVADGLLALAVGQALDASGLRRATPTVLRSVDPDGVLLADERGRARLERNAHHQRHLSIVHDDRGGAWTKCYSSIEEAEELRQVLLAHAAPVTSEPGACGGDPLTGERGSCPAPSCAHDGRDPRDGSTRMWDALVQVARVAAASPLSPNDHGARPLLMITADVDQLTARLADRELCTPLQHGRLPRSAQVPDAALLDGTPLSVHALRRLACDAAVIPAVLGSEGAVLDVGRAHRLVTPQMWTALVLRDRHCAFPGCTRPPAMSDAHHVVHWADGGDTSLDNLVLLCRHHHRFLHASPWEVAIDPATRLPHWIPPPGHRATGPWVRPLHPPPRAA